MLTYAMLAAAMTAGAPQTAADPTPAAPVAQTAPAQTAPATTPQAAPASETSAAQPAPATDTAAATQPAPAEQVASVIDQQFATYDKDANGNLNEAEFGAWMVALKTQTDPATDANAPATKSWNKAAFAQADKDKSKSLDKTELAGFLSPTAKS
jgi:hypothetical protein